MLLLGEKELADKLLDLTKTARDEEATIPEQKKILHEMGKLYLKDAIETGNGEQFVKASALINAALVRTELPGDQRALQEILCNIYKGFLKNFESDTSRLSVDWLVEKTKKNKDVLHAIRVETDTICNNFKLHFESDINFGKEFVLEANKVSESVQTRILEFVTMLWEQATECFSKYAPCGYAVIGLGSVARQEITPYSDLEFALLIEKESEEIKEYFKNLVYLFHLCVLDLGETPIPSVAIESLNDFLSPDGDRFFDGITPRGFRLDGAMPWACKTPLGRKGTHKKEPLDLIKTPKEMAALQREDNDLGQTYRVSDILCNPIMICGDAAIFNNYVALIRELLLTINHKEKARRCFIQDYKQSIDWHTLRYGYYKLQSKAQFYRLPSSFIENLRIYFAPDHQPNSSFMVVWHLLQKEIITKEGHMELVIQLAISYGVRLLTYLKNGGQYENFRYPVKNKSIFSKIHPTKPLDARSKSRVAHFGGFRIFERVLAGCNGLRKVIEKEFLVESTQEIDHLRGAVFIQVHGILQYYLYSWSRTKFMFGNLAWARSTQELSSSGCGKTCGVEKLSDFSFIPSDDSHGLLKGMDELIDTRDCKCLSLLRTNFLVLKAIIITYFGLDGNIPKEANMMDLLTKYTEKGYKNMRERFYLLRDMSDLALLIFNPPVQTLLAKEIQSFVDDVATIQESEKTIVNIMKFELIKNLINLYVYTRQFEKGFKLCQQQIDENEREFGTEGITLHIELWYVLMGDLKSASGLPEEALHHYKKAFDILWYLRSNSDLEILGLSIDYEKSAIKQEIRAVRKLALKVVKLLRDAKRYEEGIKLLTSVLTKNGETFDIETDIDIHALSLLSWMSKDYFAGLKSGEYIKKGNQYFEDMLEIIIAKEGDHHFSFDMVIELLNTIHTWNAREGTLQYRRKGTNTYVIENIYRKYCTGNSKSLTKTEFLMKIIGKILDNESLQQRFIKAANSPDIIDPGRGTIQSSMFYGWDYFLFYLCMRSMHVGSGVNFLIPQRIEFRRTILHQAEIFCEKVVKQIVPETIYNMCLTYLEFQRIRMDLFDFVFTNDKKYLQSAKTLSIKTQLDIRQYFPGCRKVLRGIDDERIVKVELLVMVCRESLVALLHINQPGPRL